MPHTRIYATSVRQNKMNKRWMQPSLGGMRVLLQISAPFTPLSTSRFQPLPAVATHGIDVDIIFHYVTSHFSAFGRLGVPWRCSQALAFLGNIGARKSRRPQISPLLASLAALAATTCSSSWRRWQSHGVDHSTPPHLTPLPKCSSPEHTNKPSKRSRKTIESQAKRGRILSINKIFTSLPSKAI
jgi:hypothetical protein